MRHYTSQHNTMHNNTIQYNRMQCNTIQYEGTFMHACMHACLKNNFGTGTHVENATTEKLISYCDDVWCGVVLMRSLWATSPGYLCTLARCDVVWCDVVCDSYGLLQTRVTFSSKIDVPLSTMLLAIQHQLPAHDHRSHFCVAHCFANESSSGLG